MERKIVLVLCILVAICIEQTAARNLFFESRGGHFQRRSIHPCDRIGQSCSEVDCSGSCEQRSLECYYNECGIADARQFRKKRSVPSAWNLCSDLVYYYNQPQLDIIAYISFLFFFLFEEKFRVTLVKTIKFLIIARSLKCLLSLLYMSHFEMRTWEYTKASIKENVLA